MITFIHIPKTAGTSFKEVFKRNEKNIYFMYNRSKWKQDLEKKNFKNTDVIYGHFEHGFTNLSQTNQEYTTVLRDPISRVISHYKHILRSPEHKHKKIANQINSLSDFCNFIEAKNLQTRLISGTRDLTEFEKNPEACLSIAKENLVSFSCFGVAEHYEESLILFSEKFNWFKLPKVHINLGKNKLKKKPSKKELEAIVESNKQDLELYDFAIKLFNKKIEDVNHLSFKKRLLNYGYGIGRFYK